MKDHKTADVTPHNRPLWAPWRLEYITGKEQTSHCFLCDKANGDDVQNHVIARGESAFVLLNTFPYNSGHLLVAPYRHVATLTDLEEAEFTELLQLAVRAQAVLGHVMHPEGFNVGFNIGAAAGAGIADHVHGHIVPRWSGDTNFMPVLADTRIVPQALDDTAGVLRDAWASGS